MDRTRNRFFFGMIAVLLLLATAPTPAMRGSIPLWEPTVITLPGTYVVTRDIVGNAGAPVLDIQADGEVYIHGNGFELSSPDASQPVIQVGTQAPYGVTITDLRLRGGMHGIKGGGGAVATCWLELTDVIISASAESAVDVITSSLEARGIIIVEGKVGFHLSGPSDGSPASASIRESTIQADHGIHCNGLTCNVVDTTVLSCVAALVLENAEGSQAGQSQFGGSTVCFNPQPEPPAPAVQLVNSPNTVIEYNTLIGRPSPDGDGTDHGVMVDATSHGSNVTDNWIRGFGGDGVHMLSEDSTVHCNVVTNNGGNGILLGGFNNFADDNKVGGNSNGTGLYFETDGHIYRGNILRNNVEPVGGPGQTSATDGGGNIL